MSTPDESLPSTGHTSAVMATYARFRQSRRLTGPAMLFVADSPARTSAPLEQGKGSTASGLVCGLNLPALFAFYDRNSSSWKTPQSCLFAELEEFLERFTKAGLMLNGRLYPRVPLERRTFDDGRSLFATPTVADNRTNWSTLKRTKNGRSLAQDVGGVPTPEFVEWLMGFPPGWTETGCGASETPSSPR